MTFYRIFFTLSLCILLTACGTTASLTLPPDYIAKHATPAQPTAPSNNLNLTPRGQ